MAATFRLDNWGRVASLIIDRVQRDRQNELEDGVFAEEVFSNKRTSSEQCAGAAMNLYVREVCKNISLGVRCIDESAKVKMQVALAQCPVGVSRAVKTAGGISASGSRPDTRSESSTTKPRLVVGLAVDSDAWTSGNDDAVQSQEGQERY